MNRPTTLQETYAPRQSRVPLKIAVACVGIGVLSLTGLTDYVQAFVVRTFPSTSAHEVAGATDIAVPAATTQTVELLRAARNVDPSVSRGGGDIATADGTSLIADSNPFTGVLGDTQKPAAADQIALYVVQEGDTLSQVAEMFGVSVNTVVWANELASNRDIHPGQMLLILPINGVQYTVAKGDTLSSIAKEYGGDPDEILVYNGLASEAALAVGTTITIPGGEVHVETKVATPSTSGATKTTGTASAGYFIHPVPGSVKTQGVHGYNGIDFGAPAGTPIRAAAAGRVIVSRAGSWNGGYGNYVVVDHPNGMQTLYAHNTKNIVWQGQEVVQGQIIGYVGSTGRSTGNHLHFEVRGGTNPF